MYIIRDTTNSLPKAAEDLEGIALELRQYKKDSMGSFDISSLFLSPYKSNAISKLADSLVPLHSSPKA